MSRMEGLYQRLAVFGIDKRYARAVALPKGWRDRDADANPTLYSMAISLLSRNLNIDIRALQNDATPLVWKDCGSTRFKHGANLQTTQLEMARCLVAGVAQMVCCVVENPPFTLPVDGNELRSNICTSGVPCITLSALLDYCWSVGIPVLPLTRFPAGAKKPDALAGLFAGRPAIVLCKPHKHTAKMLFILAHELGHIALKHIEENCLWVDEHVDTEDRDAQEEAANTFAMELLTGRPDVRYQAPYNQTAEQLAQTARMIGERDGIDPGVVLLHFMHNRKRHPAAYDALTLIEANVAPVEIVRAELRERFDWEELTRERYDYVRRITQTEVLR